MEKKKIKIVKKVPTGPMIRYHSFTSSLSPAITNIEIKQEAEEFKSVDEALEKQLSAVKSFERTFVSFTNVAKAEEAFKQFRRLKSKKKKSRRCALTKYVI